ncbi:Glycerophosphocholine acyltransferase 1 [Entamoeba marina]
MSDTSSNTKPILTMGGTEFTPKQLKQIQTFTQDDLKLIDKVTFVLVFGIMLIGEYVILQRPELMYIYYIMLMVPLIGMRLYIFALNKWHYFLLDFCYVTNIIIAQLIIRTYFTHQPIGELIQIAFVLANGPLLTAIPVWNNSLVFHDFDKVISCSIHFLPSMVVYCIRWYSNIEDIPENLSFTYGFVYPLIIYGIWQIFYLIVTEYLRKDYIFENGCMTSVRWLTEEKPHVAIDFF